MLAGSYGRRWDNCSCCFTCFFGLALFFWHMAGFQGNVAFIITVVKSYDFTLNLKILDIVLKTS